MKTIASLVAGFLLYASAAVSMGETEPITRQPWQEVVVSVSDIDRTARFFVEIGGYVAKWRGPLDESLIAAWELPQGASGEALLLGPADYETGLVRLVRFDDAGPRVPMRPGSRTWDTGCFFSMMVRMKNMEEIYRQAIELGWWTETPIAPVNFRGSELRAVIYRGPDGIQVSGYERLYPPLPDSIPPFESFTGPFNMMQMVNDRDATHDFFTQILGFESNYRGDPFVAKEPTPHPLGIPLSLSTSVLYRAGIVYPQPSNFGRMEMVEFMSMRGFDFSERCHAPNLGILAVRFPVDDAQAALQLIEERGWPIRNAVAPISLEPYGPIEMFAVETPDNAIIQLYSEAR
ncbi:hypothetical protein [Candidatus Foliamicus sp.]